MEERYPYLRFVIDAGQVIAGLVAVIVLLSGTVSSCHHGLFGGLLSLVITVLVALIAYVSVMVHVELLRAFLDVESNTRQLLAARREHTPPANPS